MLSQCCFLQNCAPAPPPNPQPIGGAAPVEAPVLMQPPPACPVASARKKGV
jgi:hypothetical protein